MKITVKHKILLFQSRKKEKKTFLKRFFPAKRLKEVKFNPPFITLGFIF